MKVKVNAIVSIIISIILISNVMAVTVKTSDGSGGDTWLNYYNQGANYGSEESFLISKDHVPYIKLDLSAIGPNMITDANFALYANPGYSPVPSYDYSFAIFGVLDGSDDWTESTIKYNNAPVITNPITWNPRLKYLGRVNYTTSDPCDLMVMQHTGGQPLNDFLNNRGPDNIVTLIIASDKVTEQRFFSTKEDHGDGSEAPFITFQIDSTPAQYNNWVGTDSNDWNDPDNWINESGLADVPDSNSIVNITGGLNLPVVVDSNAQAKKVFVYSGGLNLTNGTLNITDGVLRVKDETQVNLTNGDVALSGDVEGYMWGIIGTNKIITSKPCQQEVYAERIDVNDGNNVTTTTWIRTRDIERRLSWLNSIVDAVGTLGRSSDPYPPQARAAHYCVDRSGMIGAEAHIGSIGGGATVPGNYYYAYNMAYEEPVLKFEFDSIYNLTEMLVWNYELGYALKKVKIEYSTDDVSYTTLQDNGSDYFYLTQGNKLGTKNDVIDFGGVPAKYVKITATGGPGIGNYEATGYGRYILREVQFRHQGLKACEPNPANNNTTVQTDIDTLSWIPGKNATVDQDVWFGVNPASLTKIADNLPPCQDSAAIPNDVTITSDTQYYWRVDSNDGSGPVAGRLWTFTTKPYLSYSPGGEGIVYAFGIKTSGGSKGYLATNGSGITGDLRTSTADTTMWYCANPADVGITEPELYVEFDKIYDLNEMWVWNYPSNGGAATQAWKTIEIKYSTDGYTYNTLGTTVLPQGDPNGLHDTEISFGVPARYVRIKAKGGTGVGNYGSTSYRLCEVRFYADGAYTSSTAFDPAPADNSEVDIFTQLSWQPGTAAVTGQDIWFGPAGSMVKVADNTAPTVSSYTLDKPLDNYTEYKWRVDSIDGNSVSTGTEWTFNTRARLRFNPVVIGIVNGEYTQGIGGSAGTLAVDWSGLTYDSHYTSEDSSSYSTFSWGDHTWYCRKPWDVGITEPNLVIEFDRIYEINEMWVWNHDGTDAAEYPIAMKTIKVEYSTDGSNYTSLGNTVLPHGDPEGWHDTEIDFGGVPAKYVRIRAIGGPGTGNYGSTTWGYKLRELRFYYEVPLWSDLNVTKNVDFEDYAVIAADWLDDNWTGIEPVPCPGKPAGDVNGDCKVDETDIEWLAEEWLADIN